MERPGMHNAGLLALVGAVFFVALVAAGPASAKDLAVSISVPTGLEHNGTFAATMRITNDASGATGAPVEVQLFVDSVPQGGAINIGAMNSNTTATTAANLTLPCGSHTLGATVDPNDTVSESNESNNNATLPIVVQPLVDFTFLLTGNPGELTLTLTAQTEGCTPLDYAWDLEGVTATGSPATFEPLAGDYNVTLTASSPSDTAVNRSVTKVVTVPNEDPTVSATLYSNHINTGQALALQVQAGDIDGSVTSFLIDFGDGNSTDSLTEAFDWTYARAGNYTVTVTAFDNLAAQAVATVQVEVTNRRPIAHVPTYFAGTAGSPITFDGSLSSDPDGGPVTITWDFGDGQTGTGAEVSHTYDTAKDYQAVMTVTDQDGATDTAPITVHVVGSSDGGGGALVAAGIIGFIAVLLLGYYLLVLKRKEGQGKGEGEGSKPEDKGDEAESGKDGLEEKP